MAWLDVLRSGAYGDTLNGFSRDYTDPATGWIYHAVYSGGGYDGQGNQNPSTLVNYIGTDGPWHEGQVANVYDLAGNVTSTFVVENPTKREWFDYIPPVILAVTGAAVGGFLGPEAAFGASSTQVSAAASLSTGESLVASGAAAPAAVGGAAPAAAAAAGGTGLAGTLSGIASIGTKVIGAVTALAGIRAKNAAAAPVYAASPVMYPGGSNTFNESGGYAAGVGGVNPLLLLAGAGALVVALIVSKK